MAMQFTWKNLRRPFFALAPMEDVTDTVFRRLIGGLGAPDVYFTEFVNADGLCSAGYQRVAHRLKFTEHERPLIAQIWGNNPDNYNKAARLIAELGFDGIDINMGCPVNKVVKRGSCSGLIDNPALAKELILAAREGADGLPVSVKTRLGNRRLQTEEWFSFLLDLKLPVITVHGRIAKHLSKVPANWAEIKKVVALRDAGGYETLIIGNGDVSSYTDGLMKHEQCGVDGLMVGRGIFKNPFLFNQLSSIRDIEQLSASGRVAILLNHVNLFEQTWSNIKPFAILKKYFKIYIAGFPGAGELRAALMESSNIQQVKVILSEWSPPLEAALREQTEVRTQQA